ncbi:MAG: helix-turn-helix domain-containing protein [Bdellovibrionales bacterium]|nr:helix-turn-helix domain-containing protein [Bdellovibrionales bacterium]
MNENTMSNECHSDIGEKLATLAKSKGYSQGRLAEEIDISRVSINRFFKGKSSIRTRDLIQLLKVLDIDLEDLIAQKVASMGVPSEDENGFYQDVIAVIERLDPKAKSNLIEQVVWWGKCVLNDQAREASYRLQTSLHQQLFAG